MISVLIPSNSVRVHSTVAHLLDMDVSVDYEIIVCSSRKLNINHKRVKIIRDPDGNIGSIAPVNECLKASQGDYFFSTPDDHLPHRNCFNIQQFIEETHHFKNREYKITSTGWRDRPFCGPVAFITGTLMPNGLTNPLVGILAMPAGARSTVENLLGGVIFNETFMHVAADNFLSLYVASKEHPPVFMPDTECGRDYEHSDHEELRDRDRRAYFALVKYFTKNPNMPYNYVLDYNDEDVE